MALRALFLLHVLSTALVTVILLGKASATDTTRTFSLANPWNSHGVETPDTCFEAHKSFLRYDNGNQSDSTPSQATTSLHLFSECLSLASSQRNANTRRLVLKFRSVVANSSKYSRLSPPESQPINHDISHGHESSHWQMGASKILGYGITTFTASSPLVLLLSCLWLYFSGSLFFDIGHYTLHKCSKSKSRILRNIGYLHEVHHLYFNRRLKFNDRYRLQNMCYELPLELFCQLFGTYLGYLITGSFGLTGPTLLSNEIFTLVLVFEITRSFIVACMDGRDSNHKSYSTVVPRDPHAFLIGPEYHALHHVDPTSYLGSSFKNLDWFLGTSCSLQSRRVTIVGPIDTFGAALKQELRSADVSCVEELNLVSETEENFRTTIEVLKRTDILILGYSARSDELIQLFKKHHMAKVAQSLLLPEVWQVDSSLKPRDSSTAHAIKQRADEDILYRQIIRHSNTKSLIPEPELAAKMALWWIKRGVRTVPATMDFSTFFYFMDFLPYLVAR